MSVKSICIVSLLCLSFAPGCGESHGAGAGSVDKSASELGAVAEANPGDLCESYGEVASCGSEAVTICDLMSGPNDLQWGPCMAIASLECEPFAVVEECESGVVTCAVAGGVPYEDDSGCFDDQGSSEVGTPLLLRFDEARIDYSPMSSVGFDIEAMGQCESFDWPMADTPWLALDRDGNGAIEDGTELFGSGTRLETGVRATNGFEALRELDSNGDGVISALDRDWTKLSAWGDVDGDRVGSGLELSSVSESGLLRIELDYHVDRVCDARGNCEVEKASFVYVDRRGQERTGEVVDVHLACQ